MNEIQDYQDRVRTAVANDTALCIRGHNSKAFYGRDMSGEPLSLDGYTGIIDYTPTELVISARAATTLAELETVLADAGQMLAFEPPAFGSTATLGGTIACGLSGPRRPWSGAVRDFVLGINCINGHGEFLRFGGQVMKNVAGYDLSRTLTGSLGTLALLLDIHLKVLPRPETELTLRQTCTEAEAITRCCQWSAQPLPLTAACYFDGHLTIRLSGTARGVAAAGKIMGGEQLEQGTSFWEDLKEHRLAFHAGDLPLWRISLPAATPPLQLDGEQLLDWGGAQRWLRSDTDAGSLRATIAATGGHATLFRGGDRSKEVFHPLQPAVLTIHQRLKQTFDPHGIFNPGHMYAGL